MHHLHKGFIHLDIDMIYHVYIIHYVGMKDHLYHGLLKNTAQYPAFHSMKVEGHWHKMKISNIEPNNIEPNKVTYICTLYVYINTLSC